MFKRHIFLIIFTFFLVERALGSSVSAANYNDTSIPLRLKTGVITEAEFPESIANVTKGIPSVSLQVETLGNRMFLLPLENIETNIYVVTSDNVSYCLHLIMDEIQAPTRIKINKRPEVLNKPEGGKAINTIELMKAILSGKMPQGSTSSKLEAREIFNNGKFRIAINEIYELPGNVKALCLTFENLTHKPVVVPIEHIELPGLLAISVESQLLEARPHNPNKKDSAGYIAKAYMIIEGQSQ
ncbi:MAG: hypothetical protein PHW33_02820 [Candidatus Portnoybacteria bacterium]|nr:hypothetical protein [Candidatus Portnoybacteria bacterium]